jgi:PKD repeat protein
VANFTFSCSGLGCNFTSTSSDPDGTIATYSWTFGDGGTSTAQNPSHTYAAGGSYTATLRVTDNQGAQSTTTSKTVTVTAPNQAPTASFTRSCSGLTCSFTSTSSDPDGTIASYSWTFGDGGTSTLQNPSHTYAAGGSYTATLRVTDNQGAQSTAASQTFTVSPPNSPPVVNAGPDETAVTGLLFSEGWSFTDANHNGPWTYTINWGDGTTSSGTVSSEGSFNTGHTYVIVLPRSFTITVTVRDASGASASDTKMVSVLLL